MLISSELLEIELADLRKRRQQLIDNANAITGAIQFCEHLIQSANQPLPEELAGAVPVG